MALRPIVFHSFTRPVPYSPALGLQQNIHELQLQQRRFAPGSNQDVLLLLQHRPVYTAGRRQNNQELRTESTRLRHLGADFVATQRGGQTTYHGPGQVVGYPLFDLGRMRLSVADYVRRLQTVLKTHFHNHYGITTVDAGNTGVFVTPNVKLASIGVQVRHRLTSHGFAYNLCREPLPWFRQVVACGLADVTAGCLTDATGRQVSAERDLDSLLIAISHIFGREVARLDITQEGQLEEAIRDLEVAAAHLGSWAPAPTI